MARHPDGEDATPTARPAPGRTDLMVAKAVKAARDTVQALPADSDAASIAALAGIVNRALILVGLVVVVLGGMVGVYLGLGYGGATVTSGPSGTTTSVGPGSP